MLQQVLSQLAIYSINTVNIGLVECGDNGANINIALPSKITKLVARFFERMENHILEGSYPDTNPAFTPRDTNPSIPKGMNLTATTKVAGTIVEKSKADASPPGTPARKRPHREWRCFATPNVSCCQPRGKSLTHPSCHGMHPGGSLCISTSQASALSASQSQETFSAPPLQPCRMPLHSSSLSPGASPVTASDPHCHLDLPLIVAR